MFIGTGQAVYQVSRPHTANGGVNKLLNLYIQVHTYILYASVHGMDIANKGPTCTYCLSQAVGSYSHPGCYSPPYCHMSGASLNATCCHLYDSTKSFTLSVQFCDCTRLCPDAGIFSQLSDGYCNGTDYLIETCN